MCAPKQFAPASGLDGAQHGLVQSRTNPSVPCRRLQVQTVAPPTCCTQPDRPQRRSSHGYHLAGTSGVRYWAELAASTQRASRRRCSSRICVSRQRCWLSPPFEDGCDGGLILGWKTSQVRQSDINRYLDRAQIDEARVPGPATGNSSADMHRGSRRNGSSTQRTIHVALYIKSLLQTPSRSLSKGSGCGAPPYDHQRAPSPIAASSAASSGLSGGGGPSFAAEGRCAAVELVEGPPTSSLPRSLTLLRQHVTLRRCCCCCHLCWVSRLGCCKGDPAFRHEALRACEWFDGQRCHDSRLAALTGAIIGQDGGRSAVEGRLERASRGPPRPFCSLAASRRGERLAFVPRRR